MWRKLLDLFSTNSNNAASVSVQPLVFKDNQAAFDYACEYLDCSTEADAHIAALVDDVMKLPDESYLYIVKVASRDGGISVATQPLKPADFFEVGSLVAFLCSGEQDIQGHPIGLIGSRILPEMDLERGWRISARS